MPLFAIGERRVELRGQHHYIAYDATIVGSVILESDVNVWFKVVIRADNDQVTIGEGTNIQDGSVLHVDPGYPMQLEGVLVLGSPGKVVRDLKQEEKDYLLKIAQGYINRSRFYREYLKPIT